MSRLTTSLPDHLQTLPLNIAVVGADGVIRQINTGWHNFGKANGLSLPDDGVGRNYFEFCTPDQVQGLEQVVTGNRHEMSLVYPCHSAEQARWMVMIAVPLRFEAPTGLLLMHYDITDMLPDESIETPLDDATLPPEMLPRVTAIATIVEQATLGVVALERMRQVTLPHDTDAGQGGSTP